MKPKKKQFFFIFQLGIKKATKARILKLLRSPRIDSKEPIPAGCVAWRAGTTTPFLLGSQPSIDCLKIPALVQCLY